MKILKDHTTKETAYIVDDYPYGFRLRCKIRYWLEHHPTRGSRLCSQTTNPKREAYGQKNEGQNYWNTPKCSTFAHLAGCMYLNKDDHVTWTGLNEYSTAQESITWYETYKDGLTPELLKRVEAWIRGKRKFEEAVEKGKIEITVTSRPFV
jgi:hypothetical protein